MKARSHSPRRAAPAAAAGAVLLALVGAPGGAHADRAALPDSAVLEPVRAGIEAQLDRLAAAGLPTGLVIQKVREGLAKQVPAPRIAAATGALERSLVSTDAAIRTRWKIERAPAAVLEAAVAAQQSGLSAGDVGRLLDAASARRAALAAQALLTAADLAARGYPAARSTDVVTLVVADARPQRELSRVVVVLEGTRALGHGHALAADLIATALEQGSDLTGAARMARGQPAGAGPPAEHPGKGKGKAKGRNR